MSGKRKKELDALVEWLHAHPKWEYGFYAVLAVLALTLFLTAGRGGNTEQVDAPQTDAAEESKTENLEERLKQTLSCIEGAGKVEVMISYESSEEIVPALSVDVQESESGDSGTTSRSEQPVTVGSGAQEGPLVLTRRAATVRGAIVVAEGAGDVSVRMDLQRAAQAVLDIPASRIEVFAMKQERKEN